MSDATRPWFGKFDVVVCVICGLMTGWLGGVETYRWHLLRQETAEVQAVVTADRRNPSHKAFGGSVDHSRLSRPVPVIGC